MARGKRGRFTKKRKSSTRRSSTRRSSTRRSSTRRASGSGRALVGAVLAAGAVALLASSTGGGGGTPPPNGNGTPPPPPPPPPPPSGWVGGPSDTSAANCEWLFNQRTCPADIERANWCYNDGYWSYEESPSKNSYLWWYENVYLWCFTQ